MLRSIISCLIYIHVVVFLQSTIGTTACDKIEVTNALHQTGRHGIYEKMSSDNDCSDRPTYDQSGFDNYMFYNSSYGIWIIGPTPCTDQAGMHVVSNATTPEQVTETWKEYDGDNWVDSASLQVGCYIPPNISACDVEVRNSLNQKSMNGIYKRMSSDNDCNYRPTYEQTGSANYIHYYYVGYWAWIIGPTPCSIERGIRVVSNAATPDQVTETWEEYAGDIWSNYASLNVVCYTPPPSTDSAVVAFYAWLTPAVVVVAIMPKLLGVW